MLWKSCAFEAQIRYDLFDYLCSIFRKRNIMYEKTNRSKGEKK